ncbi:HlyD family secretion protein [Rickettsiales endosymbiont of Stachyamoeba lipophora]|uniref:HlyD family secretion protein n=1 Tax=Rickettsiales endosymbiont of Stachyamoeba lipophora TaxID=2486578 RepID=UPI000F64D948|nr:HlyD family secretion protein [Rickettsiales endosymbiont of Stachyamoeba lipophora]AZL15581.1 HlyD family secretion protein [Rickettsiales endosymbiont of Stachyamoeba lipophora]
MHKNTKLAVLTIGVLGVIFIISKFLSTSSESSDNAYLKANIIPVAAKVDGFISKINFSDNAQVEQDEILFEIDAKDYTNKQIIAASELQIAEADLSLAEKELRRAKQLKKDDFASEKALDQAANKVNNAVAIVNKARAKAELQQDNLNHTKVRAQTKGVVNNRAVAPGQLVRVGQMLAYLVDDQNFWVEANLKETQLKNLKPGQKVEIKLDAYPGKKFMGRVEGIAKATGADFSILPPENATGNFTKIIRRVPVKIGFDKSQDLALLKSGLSATIKIYTN